MTVYVDNLEGWGWRIRGRKVHSCHMFTDTIDLTELHALAVRIGMKPEWFQPSSTAPHYDLVKVRRDAAVALGAVEVDRHGAVRIWNIRRDALRNINKPVDGLVNKA